jgi:hypothetical protein
VETAAGTIFKAARSPQAASRLKQEAILLDELAPRGFAWAAVNCAREIPDASLKVMSLLPGAAG